MATRTHASILLHLNPDTATALVPTQVAERGGQISRQVMLLHLSVEDSDAATMRRRPALPALLFLLVASVLLPAAAGGDPSAFHGVLGAAADHSPHFAPLTPPSGVAPALRPPGAADEGQGALNQPLSPFTSHATTPQHGGRPLFGAAPEPWGAGAATPGGGGFANGVGDGGGAGAEGGVGRRREGVGASAAGGGGTGGVGGELLREGLAAPPSPMVASDRSMIAQVRWGLGFSVQSLALPLEVVHRVSSSLLGPVDPSFRALSGRLKFTVRRHKFNQDSFS